MEVEAKARYMRIPPRKARLVAATVIGMPVKDALVVLDFTPRAAAKELGKVVKSAAANATNNFSQDEDALVVKRIIVNEGPTIKRGRPRARGMYFSIFKRTSHITAVVEAIEQEPRQRARRQAAAPAAAPKATPAKADTKKAEKKSAKAEETTVEETEVEETKAEETKVEQAVEESREAEAEADVAGDADADTPADAETVAEGDPAAETEKENA